ncbi:hypothetical protein CAPTEDRAFT_221115 [Capitella teleta]|uniref:ADF-H domain-containing protein n=1 Tax=Capitella teleta TaxID=283909 RepID=R7VJZ9_CAPTE|nr:hypothetical protein CAPTEDRAFT_221115 [Capitella teleta]|eukprot:ELU16345.1 hypothetical protein CAPTEDRAFT_221115 [Capitella teleta]
MEASGVAVNPECVALFNDIKLKHSYRYIVYALTDDLRQIRVLKTAPVTGTYDEFVEDLKEAEEKRECRYGVFDAEYELANGEKRSKLVFFLWSPDSSKVKQKMVYTSSKDALRKTLVGVGKDLQANDHGDLAWSNVLEAKYGRYVYECLVQCLCEYVTLGMSSQSDEDYWLSSRAVNKKNPFADDVDYTSAQQILKQPFLDDVEDDEDSNCINWDGSALSAAKTDIKSVRYRPTNLPTSLPLKSTMGGGDVNPAVSSRQPKRQPTLTEMSKLEAEINCLKRNLESARKEKYSRVPPAELVKNMILGQPYSLEMYKSKEDKLALLDAALEHYDGNVITAAVLHLKDTVKPSIFHIHLMQRPAAVDHYLNYLLHHHDYDQYMDLLPMLGRTEDAAMFKYKQCVGKEATSKIRSLKACYGAHFQSDPMLAHSAGLIQEQIALLERQIPIEDADKKEEQKGEMKFRDFPRVSSLINMPVLTTLFYSCLYHFKLPENCLASPIAIRKEHRLTEKQYSWTVLQARAKLKQWQDIEALFQTKGWLGGTKMKAAIGFDRVVPALQRLGAPRNILNKYCKLIEPADSRISIGEKCGCHETVLELRDRQGVMLYQSKIKANTQEWFFANDILKNTNVKWKN